MTSKDTGSNSNNFAAPSLDSIAEIKVQTSNFQAEYGRSSGATIVAVTKSGSQNFRGSLAYFRRDESFNSNSWERNRQCAAGQAESCSKPPYEYNNTTYTIGGPVLLPAGLNRNRDKLFFFWAQDLLPKTDPNELRRSTMPTELQRRGDFSQTFDARGRLIFIRDPLASGTCDVRTGGPACFPGNRIPTERINALGQAMLNLFPTPNASDPKIVPGTGDPTNGMVVVDSSSLGGSFRPAPRIGFGWDLTGDGKTAVRGGAGVFYDRYSDDTILRLIEAPR